MDIKEQLDIIKRGIVNLVNENELADKLKSGKKLRIKLGVDPTSSNLHLGHSVVLNKLRQFQDLGHTAVLIIGDFTAQVGDPSGRDSTRPVLDYESVKKNAETYTSQAFKILDKNKTEIRFNSEWLSKFTQTNFNKMPDFFAIAKNITISRLLEREDFKNRMKQEIPISLLEILYPVFQGYDSVSIKADVELGGQDQIFNLLVGRDLQKIYSYPPQVVITCPLLVGTDGVKKMSKSYGNYIALNDEPNEIFGKMMSIDDNLMYNYYELLTNKNLEEVKNKHPMEAKKELAEIIIERFYDRKAAENARLHFENVFSKNKIPQDMPVFEFSAPTKLTQIMVLSGIVKSNNEARRLIQSGAVKIDSKKIDDDFLIEPKDCVLQAGKRNFRRLKKA